MLRILNERHYWSQYNSTSGIPLPSGVIEGVMIHQTILPMCVHEPVQATIIQLQACAGTGKMQKQSEQTMDLLLTPAGIYVAPS